MKSLCNLVGRLSFAVVFLCLFPLNAYSCDAIKNARTQSEKTIPIDNEQRKNLAIQLEKALLACAPSKLTRLIGDASKTKPVTLAKQIEGVWLSTLISPIYTGLTGARSYVLFIKKLDEDEVRIQYMAYNPHNDGSFAGQKGKPFIDIAKARLKLSNGVARAFDFHRSLVDFHNGPPGELVHNLLLTDFEGFTRVGLASPDMLFTIDAIDPGDGPYSRPRTWVRTSKDRLDIVEMLIANGAASAKRPFFCLNEIVTSKRFERDLSSHGLVREDLVRFAHETRAIEEDRQLLLDPDRRAIEKFGIDLRAFMVETGRRFNDVDPKMLAFLDTQRSSLPSDFDPLCPDWYADTLNDVKKFGKKNSAENQ